MSTEQGHGQKTVTLTKDEVLALGGVNIIKAMGDSAETFKEEAGGISVPLKSAYDKCSQAFEAWKE